MGAQCFKASAADEEVGVDLREVGEREETSMDFKHHHHSKSASQDSHFDLMDSMEAVTRTRSRVRASLRPSTHQTPPHALPRRHDL